MVPSSGQPLNLVSLVLSTLQTQLYFQFYNKHYYKPQHNKLWRQALEGKQVKYHNERDQHYDQVGARG